MGISNEIGRAGGEFTGLLSESGRGLVDSITNSNRSLLGELFKKPFELGGGILGISMRTVARLAGVLGLGAGKTALKAGAALPFAPMPSIG